MKKVLKQLAFTIPIILVILIIPDVKAIDVCESESASTSRQVSITKTNISFSVPGVHDNAYFYMFSLDGVPALCLDAGKPLRSVKFYLKSNSPITNIYIKKAYIYAKNNSGNIGKRLVAQIVTWAARKNYTEFSLPVLQGFSNYAQRYRDVSQNDALTYLNELLNVDVSGLNLYIWEKPGSDMQNLVSEFGGDDTPCRSSCSLENINELPVCSGVSTSNVGTIYQQAVGECSMTYDSSSPDQYNYYGKLDTTTDVQLGRFCGLYRKESVIEEFPGNIATAVKVGRYIVWPNNNMTSNSNALKANLTTYPLNLTFKREYKILADRDTLSRNYGAAKTQMQSHAAKGESPYIADRCASISQRVTNLTNEYNQVKEQYDACSSEQNCYLNNGGTYVGNSCGGHENCSCYNKSCSAERQRMNNLERKLEEATTIKTECEAYGVAYEKAKAIIAEFNKCISASIPNEYGSVDVQMSSNHSDRKYDGYFALTESYKTKLPCTDCVSGISQLSENPRTISTSQLLSKIDSIQSRNIVVSMKSYYDLQEGYYYYINKQKNESVNSNYGLTNFETIGFSNMPISYDAPVGTSIPLKLTLNVSGTSFDAELSSQNYTCHYEVTRTTGSCECPDGTPEEGTNLDCLISQYNIVNVEKITCADGQVLFCDSSISETETRCPVPTCPNDPSMDLTACINDGNDYNSCVAIWCNDGGPGNNPDNPRKPVCPAGTNEGMDLTSCVIPMVNKGMSYEDALEYCVDVTCPIKGIKIIYRTISLSNPFPSFDADSSITQTGLSIGMFNDTVKGRYPGANWNSKTVVKNVILNNRRVDGDEVYNKTPLYTFVLNSDTIRAIRNYNKNTDYADFNLNCKLNNSAACVSGFVHNSSLSGLVANISKSTCGGTLTADNFYLCADKEGVNG